MQAKVGAENYAQINALFAQATDRWAARKGEFPATSTFGMQVGHLQSLYKKGKKAIPAIFKK